MFTSVSSALDLLREHLKLQTPSPHDIGHTQRPVVVRCLDSAATRHPQNTEKFRGAKHVVYKSSAETGFLSMATVSFTKASVTVCA